MSMPQSHSLNTWTPDEVNALLTKLEPDQEQSNQENRELLEEILKNLSVNTSSALKVAVSGTSQLQHPFNALPQSSEGLRAVQNERSEAVLINIGEVYRAKCKHLMPVLQ